jgi:hypothetical protein
MTGAPIVAVTTPEVGILPLVLSVSPVLYAFGINVTSESIGYIN